MPEIDPVLEELSVLGEGRSDSISQSRTRLGPSGRESFSCGPQKLPPDLRCQAGKQGRLPTEADHREMGVDIEEVVKTILWVFPPFLGSLLKSEHKNF